MATTKAKHTPDGHDCGMDAEHCPICRNTLTRAPLTGWRIGDAGHTVFGPKTSAPAPLVLLTGTDRDVVRLAAAAPELRQVAVESARQIELFRNGHIDAETALNRIGSVVGPALAKVRL